MGKCAASYRDEGKDATLSDDLKPPVDKGVRNCVGQDERDAVCDEEADIQILWAHLRSSTQMM